MYTTNKQTDVRHASSLNAPYPRGGGITKLASLLVEHYAKMI